jgi:large subunit ribosomal protein L25
MKHFELSGTIREKGNKAALNALRKQGLVPCNLYGGGMENILFTVDAKELKGVTDTPASYIIDLSLSNGKKYTTVLHELQWHPVRDNCLHVDFLNVDEKKPISIVVPVITEGHPIGVQKGGKFFHITKSLRICALMKDLPDNLVIDVSQLDIDKRIVAGDLKFDNITITSPKSTIICAVKSTRQIAAPVEAAEIPEGETAEDEAGEEAKE